jgi:integrase
MDYSALRRRVLLPAIEGSGIDWPKGQAFHMFRKTAASLIHDSGKSGRQLADWLGHHYTTLRSRSGHTSARSMRGSAMRPSSMG